MRVGVRRPAIAVLACVAVVLSGCGGSDSRSPRAGQTSPGPVATTTLTIKSFAFDPASITVAVGARVTVKNEDSAPHTVTSSAPDTFDTGRIAGNDRGSFTAPAVPGSYDYLCTIHDYMRGTLIVK
jgi:plastocyanin